MGRRQVVVLGLLGSFVEVGSGWVEGGLVGVRMIT